MTDWEEVAKAKGFAGEREMWKDLYGKTSLQQLASDFGMTHYMMRKKLIAMGVDIRGRGGPRHVKVDFEITPELIEEIKRDGLRVVAKRLGIAKYTLFRHRKLWLEANNQHSQPSTSSEEDDRDQLEQPQFLPHPPEPPLKLRQ